MLLAALLGLLDGVEAYADQAARLAIPRQTSHASAAQLESPVDDRWALRCQRSARLLD